MRGWTTVLLFALAMTPSIADDRPLPPLPGAQFQSEETQRLQADEFANPGMLWVERGSKLWSEPAGAAGKSCTSCHQDATVSMKGVAARYPAVDEKGNLLNLEGRINTCRMDQMQSPALTYESNELLGLTAYLTYQSRGVPRHVSTNGRARPFFETGRALYSQRQGQLNLACSQCHSENWGKTLRGDTISQGQTDGWPAYRLEWQTMGSLHRRLRACSLGVRADVLDYGAPEYLALELYLAWRGDGLPMQSAGIRR